MGKYPEEFLPSKTVDIDEWIASGSFLPPGQVQIDSSCLKCGRGLAGKDKLCPACNKNFDWHYCQWCDEEQPHARPVDECIACRVHFRYLSCSECGKNNPHERDDYKCIGCRRNE